MLTFAVHPGALASFGLSLPLLCALSFFVAVRGTRPAPADALLAVPFALFALVLAVRVVSGAPELLAAITTAAGYLFLPLAFFAARSAATPGASTVFWGLAAPAGAALALAALADKFWGKSPVAGPFDDANTLAALLTGLLATCIGLSAGAPRLRLATGTLGILGAAALYVAHARAALVVAVLLAGLVGLAWAARRLGRAQRAWPLPTLALLVGAGALGVFSALHVLTPARLAADASLGSRAALLSEAWAIGLEYWPLGAGLGGFATLYPQRRPPGDVDSAGIRAHSDYFELFADAGPLAAGLLMALGLLVLWRTFEAWRTRNLLAAGLGLGASALFLYAWFNHVFISPALGLCAGALAGWASAAQARPQAVRTHVSRFLFTAFASVALLATAAVAFTEVQIRAALALPSEGPVWRVLASERTLEHLAQSGIVPRAAFAQGLLAERELNFIPPGAAEREAVARRALAAFEKAFDQAPHQSGYAAQIARLYALQATALGPQAPAQAERWYRRAIALNPVGSATVKAAAQWLANQGRVPEALELLQSTRARVYSPRLRQDLQDLEQTIRERAARRG